MSAPPGKVTGGGVTPVSSVAVAVAQTRPRYQEIARSNNQCLDAQCDNPGLDSECSEQLLVTTILDTSHLHLRTNTYDFMTCS